MLDLRRYVRDIPDFPKPGILYRDLTPLMGDAAAFAETVQRLAALVAGHGAEVVAAVESRGFIFGAPVAVRLGLPFVPLRKPGKLPFRTRHGRYDLEYGSDGIEIHEDALTHGARVVVLDDLLATGGTMQAAINLVRQRGGEVTAAACIIELSFLNGRNRIDVPFTSMIAYEN